MKYTLFTILLFLETMIVSAQTSTQFDDYRAEKLRQEIALDYSMPDFSTSKIDAKVIGCRLAKMLDFLKQHYMDHLYNHKLSSIQCEQIEGLVYTEVEKFAISKIEKVGDVITIKATTKLAENAVKVKKAEIVFTFDKGLSDSSSVNGLFADLGRFIKE